MSSRWFRGRRDPRTLLVGTAVILVAGSLMAVGLLQQDGPLRLFAVVWLAGAVGQFVWAVVRYRRWRKRR